ncbi:MAG TPA: tetratricopeptide repeat protein [Planctomycetota bacterium]|nr:tetratricopeptide repeat protein [Planctomycetota bacterium]
MDEHAPSESDLRFGQRVVSQGFVTPEQVRECLRLRYELRPPDGKPAPRLSELLVKKGYLTLEQCERVMRTFSSQPPIGAETPAASRELPPDAAAAAQIPGNLMGRYIRVKKLGEGGMGEVWRAWDRDLLRWVALKFVRYDSLSELTRFQREARTIAKLSHPNIAAIYDVGDHAGKPYIAMQFIEGPTLNSFPKTDLGLLVRLVRDACLGIHHAHENGIIHRDLKPHNIIVEGKEAPASKSTRSLKAGLIGPAYRPYVVDFGLAKEAAVESQLSGAGNIVGTPAYMSPEQVRGPGNKLDARTDVYSLGVTLYELCAGRTPFRGSDPYELFKKIIEKDPPPPRKFNSAIEKDLENIIMRCLEKEAIRRYPTAFELAEDLTRFLSEEPVLARSSGLMYRVRKRVRKNALISAALLASLLVLGGASALIVRERIDRNRERRQEEAVRRADLEAAELNRRALESVKEAKELWRVRTSGRDQWESLFREAQILVRSALEKHPGLAAGHYTLGEIRQAQGSWQEAIQSFDQALALDPTLPGAWYRLGLCRLELYNEIMIGPGIIEINLPEKAGIALRAERAAPLKKAAIEAFRRYAELRGLNEESSPVFRSSQAAIAIAEGRNEEAVRICSEILTQTKTDEQAWLLKAKALCSLKEYARAIETIESLINEVMPQLAEAHHLLGWVREKQKDSPRAIAACTRALELNPNYPAAYVTRSWARAGLNDEAGMIEDASRAIAIDPAFAPAYYARGWAKERLGDFGAAVEDYGKIIALNPRYAPVYTIRGWTLEKAEDWTRSLEDYAKAVELGSNEAHDYANCARIRARLGGYAGAIDDYTRALQKDPGDAALFAERGKVYFVLKRFSLALEDFKAAVKVDGFLRNTLGPLMAECEAAGRPKE